MSRRRRKKQFQKDAAQGKYGGEVVEDTMRYKIVTPLGPASLEVVKHALTRRVALAEMPEAMREAASQYNRHLATIPPEHRRWTAQTLKCLCKQFPGYAVVSVGGTSPLDPPTLIGNRIGGVRPTLVSIAVKYCPEQKKPLIAETAPMPGYHPHPGITLNPADSPETELLFHAKYLFDHIVPPLLRAYGAWAENQWAKAGRLVGT